MEEEKKEELVEEPKEEQKQENTSAALAAFILVCVASVVLAGWIIGGIAAIVLSIISQNKQKEAGEITTQPYRVFMKISEIAAKVLIPLGAVVAIAYTIVAIVDVVQKIAA